MAPSHDLLHNPLYIANATCHIVRYRVYHFTNTKKKHTAMMTTIQGLTLCSSDAGITAFCFQSQRG